MAVVIKECTDYIIASGSRDAYRDAANLLRNMDFGTEEEIGYKLTGMALIQQKEEIPETEELEPDGSICCGSIREKYGLDRYGICSVCSRCSSVTEEDDRNETRFLRAAFSSTVGGKIFSQEAHEHILERFSVYTSYGTKDRLNAYAMVNRMIYEALYSLVEEQKRGRKDRTCPVRKLVSAEQVYERWKFLYPGYCDEGMENRVVGCKIEFYYGNPYDGDDILSLFLPKKQRARKKDAPVQEVPAAKTARETALEFDDMNILLGGEEQIDRTQPVDVGDRAGMPVPVFTDEELRNAGYREPSDEELDIIGFRALRSGTVAMDVIRIGDGGKTAMLISIPPAYRYILHSTQLAKISVYLETKKKAVTREPVSLFSFMNIYGHGYRMRLTIFRPFNGTEYLKSVMDRSGDPFSIPSCNDEEVLYHKALSYSMTERMDNMEYAGSDIVLTGQTPLKDTDVRIKAEIRTKLSTGEWNTLKRDILALLTVNSQFAVQDMHISNIDDGNRELWFDAGRPKSRGFSSILTRAVSGCIKKMGYYPDVDYTMK